MKIEFDKALLWLVPYLYLVSIIYYWSYWGSSGFDPFNHYSVSDLIKGVVLPISSAVIYSGAMFIISLILFLLNKMTLRLSILKAYIILAILGVIIITEVHYLRKDYDIHDSQAQAIAEFSTLFRIVLAASMIITIIIEWLYFLKLPINEPSKFVHNFQVFRFCAIFSLLLIPCESLTNGKEKAWLISTNKKFSYIIKKGISSSSLPIYKFLGKAGDYYIFSSLDNNIKIISPTSEFKTLSLEYYSVDDVRSVRKFRTHLKLLIK